MYSDAVAEPPGLFTRSTIAFTFLSCLNARNSRENRSPPTSSASPSPSTIAPSAYTTAISFFAFPPSFANPLA